MVKDIFRLFGLWLGMSALATTVLQPMMAVLYSFLVPVAGDFYGQLGRPPTWFFMSAISPMVAVILAYRYLIIRLVTLGLAFILSMVLQMVWVAVPRLLSLRNQGRAVESGLDYFQTQLSYGMIGLGIGFAVCLLLALGRRNDKAALEGASFLSFSMRGERAARLVPLFYSYCVLQMAWLLGGVVLMTSGWYHGLDRAAQARFLGGLVPYLGWAFIWQSILAILVALGLGFLARRYDMRPVGLLQALGAALLVLLGRLAVWSFGWAFMSKMGKYAPSRTLWEHFVLNQLYLIMLTLLVMACAFWFGQRRRPERPTTTFANPLMNSRGEE